MPSPMVIEGLSGAAAHHQLLSALRALGVPRGLHAPREQHGQHIDYELKLHVEEDSAFEESAGSPGERVAGMITGIAGPIAVL